MLALAQEGAAALISLHGPLPTLPARLPLVLKFESLIPMQTPVLTPEVLTRMNAYRRAELETAHDG